MRNLRESSISSLKSGSRTALAALLLVPYLPPPAMAGAPLTAVRLTKVAKIVNASRDDAGRLTNVADAVTGSGLGGGYVWNADGTLASMPANGYRRTMTYDEEGRLTAISKLQNGTTTALFQYGYGFDGGRRWCKDLAGGVWDWYPCGVACSAGELVTLRSTDGGTTWTTYKKTTKGPVLLTEGSSFVLSSMNSTIDASASSTGSLEGVRLQDSMGVVRSGAASTQLPDMVCVEKDADTVYAKMAAVGLNICRSESIDDLVDCAKKCTGKKGRNLANCIAKCLGVKQRDRTLDELFCIYSPDQCRDGKPIKCGSSSDTDEKQSCCDLSYFECMATTPPLGWSKCLSKRNACYIKAAVGA